MVPRKKLSELQSRFKLEPSLNDIFVEGDNDKRLIDRAFSYKALHRPVYSISTIDIPPDILVDLGLTDGNRQRVLALCQTLNLPLETAVRFLIDADLDRHLNRELSLPGLTYTVFTDAEGVFLVSDILRDLVINAGRAKVEDWPALFTSIEGAVKQIFCVRLALEEMKFNVAVPSITKSTAKNKTEIIFDLDAFINKLSAQGISSKEIKDLKVSCAKWRMLISKAEARMAGRGHDYFEILAWVIKKFGGVASVAESIEDIIVLLVPQVAGDLISPLG